ncbi:MAG: hypothetical protein PHO71_19425, partial [Bacteroides sp.]
GFPIVLESNELTFETEFGETFDYNQARNKPRINSVELIHDRSPTELGIQSKMNVLSNSEIDDILFNLEG